MAKKNPKLLKTSPPSKKKEDEGFPWRLFLTLQILGCALVLGVFYWGGGFSSYTSQTSQPNPITPTNPTPPKKEARKVAPVNTYRVINEFPHDKAAFLQGLVVDPRNPKYFFEGTGLYAESELRRVEIETGRVTHSISLPPKDFGEGVTLYNSFIFQLTWKENKIYKYKVEGDFVDRKPDVLTPPPEIREGWGITHNDEHLIISEGSYKIFFVDPETLQVEKTLIVRDGQKRVLFLNELEWIEGEIWANVWFSTQIYVICPKTGFVLRKIELTGLKKGGDVYNGIAYWKDPQTGTPHLYVTGKKWPVLYEIQEVWN